MLSTGYPINTLCQILNGTFLQEGKEDFVRHVETDTRVLDGRPHSLFVAIVGPRFDGHQFLWEAYSKGVRTFIVSEDVDLNHFAEASIIKVDNSLKALQRLAIFHRGEHQIDVVGVTGSNGKTIVKEWLYQLLYRDKHIVRSPNSYNSKLGVALSILLMNDSHDMGVFEAGISQEGEMECLEKMIKPNIGILTNIGAAHEDGFRSDQDKALEKLKLFTHCPKLIYCADHDLVHNAVASLSWEKKCKTWGWRAGSTLQLLDVAKGNKAADLRGNYLGVDRHLKLPFNLDASIENACHLWLLLLELGYSDKVINQRFNDVSDIPMRLEILVGVNGCVLVNDAYNSDLNAIGIALEQLLLQPKNSKSTAILSDIVIPNKVATEKYMELSKLLKTKGIERFIGIGPNLQRHKHLFTGIDSAFYTDTDSFLQTLRKDSFENENILLKGSRAFEFERIADRLQEKTHETTLELDLNKMSDNLNLIREKIKRETKIMAMVKAFAYGNGSYDVARLLEYSGVAYLGVAYADEGVALRGDGIQIPILVLNPEPSTYDAIIRYNLEPQIYSFRTLKLFHKALTDWGYEGSYPVHIKINTGMNRLGFDLHEIEELGDLLRTEKIFDVVSVFSHLSGSDEPDFDKTTEDQVAKFETAASFIEQCLGKSVIKHILNSNGILRFPQYQFDMVRLGIALYGVSGNQVTRSELLPVSKLKTSISQIRQVPKGSGIGYSPKALLDAERTIAVLSIGYADGLARKLGNGVAEFWVNGQRAKTVGNICMDMCMIDVTEIPCQEGDEVEIFGDHISLYEISEKLETIPYEVLTRVSERVKRVTIQS